MCAVCVVSVRCVSWCVVPLFSCPGGGREKVHAREKGEQRKGKRATKPRMKQGVASSRARDARREGGMAGTRHTAGTTPHRSTAEGSTRAGLLALFFLVVCVCLFRCPFSRWAAVPGLVLPVLAGWYPCASLGVLSSVPSWGGVWPPLVVLAGGLVAVGCFCAPPPPPSVVFFLGGGVCLFLPLPSLGWRTH